MSWQKADQGLPKDREQVQKEKLQREVRHLVGVMNVFTILIVVMFSQFHTYVELCV